MGVVWEHYVRVVGGCGLIMAVGVVSEHMVIPHSCLYAPFSPIEQVGDNSPA